MASLRVVLAASVLGAVLAPAPFLAWAEESPTPVPSPAGVQEAPPAASPSPSPSPLLPLPAPSRSPQPRPSSAPPQASPSPVRTRPSPSPTPVVTIIPAPSDQPSPAAQPSAAELPPIVIGSVAGSPDPVKTAAAKPAAKTSDSDRLSQLVKILLAAAVLLGLGGGAGLYVTRSHR